MWNCSRETCVWCGWRGPARNPVPAGTEAVETSMRIRSRVKSQFQLAVGLSRRIPRLCELAEVQGEKPSPASEHPRTRWASHFLEQRLDPSRGRLRHLKKKKKVPFCGATPSWVGKSAWIKPAIHLTQTYIPRFCHCSPRHRRHVLKGDFSTLKCLLGYKIQICAPIINTELAGFSRCENVHAASIQIKKQDITGIPEAPSSYPGPLRLTTHRTSTTADDFGCFWASVNGITRHLLFRKLFHSTLYLWDRFTTFIRSFSHRIDLFKMLWFTSSMVTGPLGSFWFGTNSLNAAVNILVHGWCVLGLDQERSCWVRIEWAIHWKL